MPGSAFTRVLFVAPGSPNYRNLTDTIACIPGVSQRFLAMDGPNAAKPMDQLLYLTAAEFEPDLLIFVPSIDIFERTPSRECFRRLREIHGIPIAQMYLDLAKPVWRSVAAQLSSVADVVISIDGVGASMVDVSGSAASWRDLWSPIRPPDLGPGPIERDIDVSMVGSVATSPRREYLEHLRRHGIEPVTGGGYEQSYGLSVAEYYRLLYRSKIVLNIAFAGHRNYAPDGSPIVHLKGRVLEALACGALLLETRNDVTQKYLMDGVDYASYDDLDDLVAKIRHYLVDEERRAAIARHGQKTFYERYTAETFWRRFFAEVAAARAV